MIRYTVVTRMGSTRSFSCSSLKHALNMAKNDLNSGNNPYRIINGAQVLDSTTILKLISRMR